ncbi:LIM and calponin y domains-containing protein 1 [Liparis tanakae]|uniref:LIM and calponin y domains-containing protein 1 n=1 Tax=Liparis tanakae TaxID=230148 RepID=A0A4Z2ILE9_9TELE|nr:LIM and calponin y domains-containing protein 1 [Liparis tanakae]
MRNRVHWEAKLQQLIAKYLLECSDIPGPLIPDPLRVSRGGPSLQSLPLMKTRTKDAIGDVKRERGTLKALTDRRLLSSIKPGLVKKINRLPAPIAGLGACEAEWP